MIIVTITSVLINDTYVGSSITQKIIGMTFVVNAIAALALSVAATAQVITKVDHSYLVIKGVIRFALISYLSLIACPVRDVQALSLDTTT